MNIYIIGLILISIIWVIVSKIKKYFDIKKKKKELIEERGSIVYNLENITKKITNIEIIDINIFKEIKTEILEQKQKFSEMSKLTKFEELESILEASKERKEELVFWEEVLLENNIDEVVLNQLTEDKYSSLTLELKTLESDLRIEEKKSEEGFFKSLFSKKEKISKEIEVLVQKIITLQNETRISNEYKNKVFEHENKISENMNKIKENLKADLLSMIFNLKNIVENDIKRIKD